MAIKVRKNKIDWSIPMILFALFLVIGELLCIVRFITSDFEPSYKREIIYGLGMVTGTGSIIGWIPISDTPQEDK